MLEYWIWLSQLPKVQPRQKRALLERFGDAEDVYYASRERKFAFEGLNAQQLTALCETSLEEAKKILMDCDDQQIRMLTFRDDAYPQRLRNIDDPPLVLYYRGELPDFEKQPVIAVVGTRKASAYGMSTARRFGAQIADCGAMVISGCAGGIDTMAMEGALDADVPLVCVMGCGVDVVYPKSNRLLLSRIAQKGCLISEYPPGTPPYSWNFPVRNRILSGMSCGVLVVEAPASSGALITARLAMEQGREVFVVPGNVGVESCEGSNALLRDHALAVFNGWDVVREFETLWPNAVHDATDHPLRPKSAAAGDKPALVAQKTGIPEKEKFTQPKNNKKSIDNEKSTHYSVLDTPPADLTEDERIVLQHLTQEPRFADAVVGDTGLPAARVLVALTTLALKGLAVNHPGRRVARKTR